MMVKIFVNNKKLCQLHGANYKDIADAVSLRTCLDEDEFYFVQDGKRLAKGDATELHGDVQCVLRVRGGKGGFGSMLRAIGAQIEKTTNREACRDLSGRRLRDINEEKRLKAWLEKQSERERESKERKKRKIAKLLAVPKHDFKDEEYEEARAKLTEKVNDAVEEGFKKAQLVSKPNDDDDDKPSTSKRKGPSMTEVPMKKKKPALWLDDDLSDTDDSDDSDSDESVNTKTT